MDALTSTSLHSVQGSASHHSIASSSSDVTVSSINTPPRRRGLLHGRKQSISSVAARKNSGVIPAVAAAAAAAAAVRDGISNAATSDDSGDELSACVHVSSFNLARCLLCVQFASQRKVLEYDKSLL
jgi:hypothetical protein